jgi:hypothetical protein
MYYEANSECFKIKVLGCFFVRITFDIKPVDV